MNEIGMKSGDSGKNYENLVISRHCQRNVAKGEKKIAVRAVLLCTHRTCVHNRIAHTARVERACRSIVCVRYLNNCFRPFVLVNVFLAKALL